MRSVAFHGEISQQELGVDAAKPGHGHAGQGHLKSLEERDVQPRHGHPFPWALGSPPEKVGADPDQWPLVRLMTLL